MTWRCKGFRQRRESSGGEHPITSSCSHSRADHQLPNQVTKAKQHQRTAPKSLRHAIQEHRHPEHEHQRRDADVCERQEWRSHASHHGRHQQAYPKLNQPDLALRLRRRTEGSKHVIALSRGLPRARSRRWRGFAETASKRSSDRVNPDARNLRSLAGTLLRHRLRSRLGEAAATFRHYLNSAFKNGAVRDCFDLATCSGVPCAMILPPLSPASGPRSMT
jgi:hypothetical protein